MIKAINAINQNIGFRSKSEEQTSSKAPQAVSTIQETEKETRILPNNVKTRSEQEFQKVTSAFIDYPVKGLKGDINSNFYEFLTMGIVPYLAGSAMFMLAFNCINKYLPQSARLAGKKMALGVVMYGLFKTASKHLVTKPIEWATGVDVEMPYENKVYSLPTKASKDSEEEIEIQYQQRKVFDSKEFYRKDLLPREYFDKVAKKLGLGENLNDSITETSPIIQNIVATSNTAKSLSTYSWAAVGVGMAVQSDWDSFFNTISSRHRFVANPQNKFIENVGNWFKVRGQNIKDISYSFAKSFYGSIKSLWEGKSVNILSKDKFVESKYMKHAGKALIGLATFLTLGLTANSIIRAKYMAKNTNKNTIDESKEVKVI